MDLECFSEEFVVVEFVVCFCVWFCDVVCVLVIVVLFSFLSLFVECGFFFVLSFVIGRIVIGNLDCV